MYTNGMRQYLARPSAARELCTGRFRYGRGRPTQPALVFRGLSSEARAYRNPVRSKVSIRPRAAYSTRLPGRLEAVAPVRRGIALEAFVVLVLRVPRRLLLRSRVAAGSRLGRHPAARATARCGVC